MTRIRDLVGEDLRWVQRQPFKMEYELRHGSGCAATLRFRSLFGSFATGESADGCWTFKRVGFLQTRATIRACGAERELAVFRNNSWTGGGTLVLPGGRQLAANTNFWMTSYEFTSEGGQPLVCYRRTGGTSLMPAGVEIHAAAATLDELPWLVMLGWYLAIQLSQDAGVAVVAGGAS